MKKKESYSQILRSSSIIGSATIVNILIGLIRIKLVAVLLGPVGIGLVGILQNVVAAAATVSSLGFGNVGTRQIAEANGLADQIGVDAARRALFWGTLLLAIIGGSFFWLLRDIIALKILGDSELSGTVGWLGLGVALTVATGSQRALLNGMRRIGDIARVTIFSSILSTLLGVPLIMWLGRNGLVWFILVAPLASFLVSHAFVARLPSIKSGPTPVKLLVDQWRTLIKLGSAFMAAGLVTILGQLLVRTIVQNELGSEQLGYFQAAWVISMTYIGFVLTAMGADYYPRLTAAIKNSHETNKLVNEQTEVAMLLAGPILLGMLALAPWVIKLLYSEAFAPAVSILRWQILGDIFKIISWPLGFVILAAGAGKTFLFTEFIAMAIFVLVTWVLIPLLGVQSTGVGFLLMYVGLLPLVYWLARSRTGFRWSAIVKKDASVLLLLAFATSIIGSWHDGWGAAFGIVASAVLGFIALMRLMTMVEVGGPLGKLVNKARGVLLKKGIKDD